MSLADLWSWFRENEALLSGLASTLAVLGALASVVAWGTRGLLRRRRRSPLPAAEAATRSPVAERTATSVEPLLAVLPFDNLSNDPEMQFFSDGVSEEIIQRLTRGARLRVISRRTSFQFRGERKALAAEDLACSHVLDGSVRRAEGRVRISAHLEEASSRTTLWSENYDRRLEDIFTLQDEISESIARTLDRAFFESSADPVDPAVYDLYLRSSPQSYTPDELRTCLGLLETATRRAPDFGEAWGRLAHLRAWTSFYLPFGERPAAASLVARDASRALELDPENVDAMIGQLFVVPPFGSFAEGHRIVERMRSATVGGDGRRYLGWYLRTTGHVHEGLVESELAFRLDSLDPMTANLVALARMAAGRIREAIPIFEDLVDRIPDMSFPVSSLLRAYAFDGDWAAVDRLLELAKRRQLRELQDGLDFIRTKRDPTPKNLDAWRNDLERHVRRTGGVDVSRLVYSAHLGLVDEAYRLAESARLGPAGTGDDIMGPDGYRTSLMFQAGMPELRNDHRFVPLCARLGLVGFWNTTGLWPDCVDELPYDLRAASASASDLPEERFEFR